MTKNKVLIYGDVPVMVGDTVYVVVQNTKPFDPSGLFGKMGIILGQAEPIRYHAIEAKVSSFDSATITLLDPKTSKTQSAQSDQIFPDLKCALGVAILYQVSELDRHEKNSRIARELVDNLRMEAEKL